MGQFTPEDVEGEAQALLASLGAGDDVLHPAEIAERLLGRGCVRVVHASALTRTGELARVRDKWRIYVRSRASEQQQRFAVAHEIGHALLGTDAEESACDLFAACVLMPRRPFARAVSTLGTDWQALASAFVCSQSAAALRYGEVIFDPLALITPHSVRVRGRPWFCNDAQRLRSLSVGEHDDVVCAQLTDAPRRTVLRVS